MATINSTTNLHKAAAQHIKVPKYVCFVRLQKMGSLSIRESTVRSINE